MEESLNAQFNDSETPLRVLVVDDKKTMRDITCAQLARVGHFAKSCHSLHETIEIVEAWQPDCVLLDLRIPGNDGFEILSALADQCGQLPWVVAMTGDATADIRFQTQVAGFDGFLSKPFQIADLKNVLRGVSKRRNSHVVLES